MPESTTLVYVFMGMFGLKMFIDYINRSASRGPYPPGPPPKPLVGNAFDFPTAWPADGYIEWGKKYNSTVVSAEALGNRIIVVNKREDAIELCERRAKLYSDRPYIPILNRLSISLTMEMMYGIEIKSADEPCIALAHKAVKLGTDLLMPGGSLANIVPVLRHIPAWFPGATSLRKADMIGRMTEEVIRIPVDQVKANFNFCEQEEGKAAPSFFTNFIEKKQTLGASNEEEEIIRNIAYTVNGAASDTTISSTGSFFYLMAANPDVQRKAQEEIDGLTGSKRLPTLEDRKSLPFVEAIYREVMRMRPPLPLGVPHRVTEDNYYKGYLIPKGATNNTFHRAMTHDEEDYPEPYTFKPERFFDENGKLIGDDRVIAYGFGRR
uniref:Cytochrome P450 n=1 Tax=Psilocybe cubensis TaxID=181762 RepID=A0A8H7XQ86_PSICU